MDKVNNYKYKTIGSTGVLNHMQVSYEIHNYHLLGCRWTELKKIANDVYLNTKLAK